MRADLTLSPDEQALALATKRDVQAAGGLEVCARETGLSDSQISRCCSPNHRDSITIRDAATIQALGHGRPGHPHILRALGHQLGFVLVPKVDGPEDGNGLMRSMMELTSELGDVAASIRDALGDGRTEPREAKAVLEQVAELEEATARLRVKLEAIVRGGEPNKT
jgi:hypothetical protein